jgi:hypothetical protein
LPKIPVPLHSQYPVPQFKRRGIEEEIGNSELFKFMDKIIIGKTPRQKESPDWAKPFKKKWGQTLMPQQFNQIA